jgi:hypothetical protein
MPKRLLNPPPDPAMPIIQPIFSSQPPILHGHSVIIHRKFRRLSQYVPKHLPAQHPVQHCLKFGRFIFAANSIPLLSKLSGPMDDYPRLTQAGTVAMYLEDRPHVVSDGRNTDRNAARMQLIAPDR